MAKHTAKAMHTTISQGRTKSRSTAAMGATGSGGRKMTVKTTGAGHTKHGSVMSTGKLGRAGQPRAAGARGFNYGTQGSKGGGTSHLTKAIAGRAKGSGPYAKRNTTGRPAAR